MAMSNSGDLFAELDTASALERMRDGKGLEPLIRLLTSDHLNVRFAAMRALGRLRDSRAVDPLVKILEHYDVCVRFWGPQNKRQLRDIISAVIGIDVRLESAAANALSRIGDVKGLRSVITLANHWPYYQDPLRPYESSEAIDALITWGKPYDLTTHAGAETHLYNLAMRLVAGRHLPAASRLETLDALRRIAASLRMPATYRTRLPSNLELCRTLIDSNDENAREGAWELLRVFDPQFASETLLRAGTRPTEVKELLKPATSGHERQPVGELLRPRNGTAEAKRSDPPS